RQFGMPGIAGYTQAIIENLFAELGLSAGSGVWAAAFIGAARIEVETDEVVCRLRFEDDRKDTRLKRVRIFGIKRLPTRFPAAAGGIEFRHVKMIPQEKHGTGA